MEEKTRYLRLKLLLDKSEIYSEFIYDKIERQKLKTIKEQEKMARQLEKKKNKEKENMQMVTLVVKIEL